MYFLFSFLSTIESAVLKYTTLFVWFSIFFLMWSILLQVFGTSLWYTFLCTLFSWCIMNGPLCLWLHFLSQICVVWYNRARLLPLWLHGISFSSGKQSTCQCRRCKKCRFRPWVGKTPWNRKWQPTSVSLPGKYHEQRSLEGYSSWTCKELDVTERLSMHAHVHFQFISFVSKACLLWIA